MARILIIDDSMIARKILKNFLTRMGHISLVGENGQDGLDIFYKEKPEVVIVDIEMPGMNGIETLKKIKKEKTDTEVIIITEHGDVETAIEAMNEKAFCYILKPVEYDELEIEIKLALEKQKMEEEVLKLSYAVKQSPATIMITGINGNIEYVNPKFCSLTLPFTHKSIIRNLSAPDANPSHINCSFT